MPHPYLRMPVAAAVSLFTVVSAMAVPPLAPAPGGPGIFVTREKLAQELRASIARAADPALSEIDVSDQYAIHEVQRSKAGPPAIHDGWTELHFILEGSATLVTGGKIVGAPGTAGSTVTGGVTQKVKKGDAILIPPNSPHWYSQVDGTVKYLEVRFIAPGTPLPKK